MNTIWQDIRFGFRMLRKNYGYTCSAVLILGLGIGLSTLIFSVVNAVLLRSLPYPDAGRIVMVWESFKGEGTSNVAWPKFMDWRKQQTVFESIAGSDWGNGFTRTGEDQPELVQGLSVYPTFFEVFQFKPLLGRLLQPDDSIQGNARVVVITEEYWKNRLNQNSAIIGKTLQLDFVNYEVVGVLRSKPELINKADIVLPRIEEGWLTEERGNRSSRVFARLNPNVTIAQAEAEMNMIAARLEQQYPETDEHWRIKVVPLHEQTVGSVRTALIILMSSVLFLLLITCVNVANLQLARATGRQKEITIRAALGANRWHVMRQLLIENVTLSLLGGMVGIITANWFLGFLMQYVSLILPNMITVSLDWWVMGFAFALSILTGIVFGLFPVMSISKLNLVEALKEGGRGNSASVRSNKIRKSLIVAETGLALVLLVFAGLLLQSFIHLSQVNPGFQTGNILTVSINPPASKYGTGEIRHNYYNQLIEKIKSVPGVEDVGCNLWIPMGFGDAHVRTSIVGREELPEGDRKPSYRIVTPDYFSTMGIPLKQGRAFDHRDTTDSVLTVLVNDAFAKRIFPNENPIGQHLMIGDGWVDMPREIVGVVGDIRQNSPGKEPKPEIYTPHSQSRWTYSLSLVIRTKIEPKTLIPSIRNAIWDVDKDQALGAFATMEQVVDFAITPQKFSAILLSLFAVTALILSALGIYGVISYSVSQYQHEIGIRMALGAQKRHVLVMVIKQGMTLVALGLTIGLFTSIGLTRFISSQLYGVTATDPTVIASVSVLLMIVGLLACYIPARRAANVDPMTALRCE